MTKNSVLTKNICLIVIITILITAFPFSVYASDISTTSYIESIEISYINNDFSGKYMQNSNNSVITSSGLLSQLGSSIKWQITPIGDDTYTIHSISNTSLYLTASSDINNSAISLTTLASSPIPSNYKWYITIAEGGGCLIRNVHTNKYLYSNSVKVSSSATLGTAGSDSYRQRVWRIPESTSYYGNTSAYSKMELPAGYKIKTLYLFTGDSGTPSLFDEYINVLWRTAENFTYSGYNTDYVTLDSSTGTFYASSSTFYSANITATHKATGLSTTFSLVINPMAVLVGVTNSGHNHLSALTTITSYITECGYTNALVYSGHYSAFDIDTYLNTDINNVFVIRSHGGPLTSNGVQLGTAILLNDDSTTPTFYTSRGTITNLDLTNMKLIMFIGCRTALGGEGGLNLPTVAVGQGAYSAIGFEDSIDCATANNWTIDFFDYLRQGYSVSEACGQLSASDDYSSTTMTSVEICGNRYTRIK